MTDGARHKAIDYTRLDQILQASSDDKTLFGRIVNTPFEVMKVETARMFLGIIVLLLVNKQTGMIDRVALSKTELAAGTLKMTPVKFEDIKIPLGHHSNVIAKAIQTGRPQGTSDWKYLFIPALPAKFARFNQAGGGISHSAVYPLTARDGGALIFSYFEYAEKIGPSQKEFMERYTATVNQALEP